MNRDPRFQGLGGSPSRLEHMRQELREAELVLLPPEELVAKALAIAGKAIAKAEVAAARRAGAAKARAKKRAPKKPDVLAKIEEVQASGWGRDSGAYVARKTKVKPSYVRRLKDGAK